MSTSDLPARSDLLMVSGVALTCPDCGGERILVPAVDDTPGSAAYCCTTCGAALLVDPPFVRPGEARVA
ncbi:MAG: hypothetical protein ACRDPG_07960 [Nocardioidaceae bacterium]